MTFSGGIGLILGLVLCMGINNVACKGNVRSGTKDGSEEWGYIEVRPKAHMFWWHYRSPQRAGNDWPTILWLQGGPGASGVAIGNFQEVGPLDTKLKPRNTTWLQKADLLFVDSPVATGFSYVENSSLVVTTDFQAADDLLSFLKEFYRNSTLQKSPLFIVAESYGGKIASMLGLVLSKAIAAGDINIKLGGVALGDSWMSPVDYVLSWGPLLKYVSRLDESDLKNVNSLASIIKEQVRSGNYSEATDSWANLESIISQLSNNVDFYNFLLDASDDNLSLEAAIQESKISRSQHYMQYLTSKEKSPSPFNLNTFMNEVIRKKLKIIPSNIQWDGQGDLVFSALQGDFMKSAVGVVDELLSRGEKVTVYNGQVDLICATIGTEAWVQQLKWSGLEGYNNKTRTPIYCDGLDDTRGFIKSYKNLEFVWVFLAGHFVPVDSPCVAFQMLDSLFATRKSS